MNYRKQYNTPSYVVALLLALAVLVFSGSGWAHTPLKSSSPASKAVLKEAPKEIQLEFAAAVKLLTLKLSDANKKSIDIGFSPSATESKQFSHPLPSLADGNYIVEWNALGNDGHKLRGLISFTIDANATAAMVNAAEHEHHEEPHQHSH